MTDILARIIGTFRVRAGLGKHFIPSIAAIFAPSTRRRLQRGALLLAATIFGTLFFLAAVPATGLLFGDTIGARDWPVALVCALVWTIVAARTLFQKWALPAVGAAVTIGLASAFVLSRATDMWPDAGPDIRTYHYTIIESLTRGFNPLESNFNAFSGSNDYRIEHFPKGSWYAYAALAKHFPFESVNFLNAWAAIGAFSALLAGLLVVPRFPIWAAGLIAAAGSADPTIMNQAFSALNDGLLAASMLAAAALALLSALRSDRVAAILAAMIVAFAINLKTSAFVIIGVAIGAVWLGAMIAAKAGERVAISRRVLIGPIAGGLIGVLIIGFEPYVKNTLDLGNPLHPVGAIVPGPDHQPTQFTTAAKGLVPEEWRSISAPEMFLRSLLSEAKGDYSWRPKAPFAITDADRYRFTLAAPTIGGFGPWFFGASLIALLSFGAAFAAARASRLKYALLSILGLIILAAAFHPIGYYARYNLYAVLAPLTAIAGAVLLSRSGNRRLLAGAALTFAAAAAGALAFNGLWILKRHVGGERVLAAELAHHKAIIRRIAGPVYFTASDDPWVLHILDRMKAPFQDVEPEKLSGSGVNCVGEIPFLTVRYARPCADGLADRPPAR